MEVEEADAGDGESFIDFSRGEVTDMAKVVCADSACGWMKKGQWVGRTESGMNADFVPPL